MGNHQQKSREKVKKLEQKTATLAAKYAKELSVKLNEPIKRCYQNEKKCDVEIKRIEAETSRLVALNQSWREKLEDFDQSLRELGDVQAYTYAIERDTRILLNVTNKIMKVNKSRPSESIEAKTSVKEPEITQS